MNQQQKIDPRKKEEYPQYPGYPPQQPNQQQDPYKQPPYGQPQQGNNPQQPPNQYQQYPPNPYGQPPQQNPYGQQPYGAYPPPGKKDKIFTINDEVEIIKPKEKEKKNLKEIDELRVQIINSDGDLEIECIHAIANKINEIIYRFNSEVINK